MNTTWCEALPYGTTPYEALFSRKPHRNSDVEEIQEMLGGIEEDEIIQGLDEDNEDPQVEELLGLVTYEGQEDQEEEFQNENTIGSETELSDSASEGEDRTLDKEIRSKNQKNREKMMQKYGNQHTIVTFKAGDLAMLRIPKDDLAPTDNRRISCLVLDVPHYNRHKLRTKYGIITHLYPTGQLNTVPEELQQGIKEEIIKGPLDELPLRTIALLASSADRVGISCNCKKRCTKTCRCQKNNVLCSIYCHAEEDLDCGNLSKLTERTERALVERNKEQEISTMTTIAMVPSASMSLPKRKRARTPTIAVSTTLEPDNLRPTTKKARETENLQISRQTRAQRQATLSQYQGLQPIVNRLANLSTKNPRQQVVLSSTSSLSDPKDSENSN